MPTPANFLRETVDLVRQIETRFLELGARLFHIQSKELWKDSYETYNEFLETAKISPGNASMLAAVHKAYHLEGGMTHAKLSKTGYSNLYAAIPLIEKDGVEKAVEKAQLLTRSELKEEVRERKHGACQHQQTITICAGCHTRIYDGKETI